MSKPLTQGVELTPMEDSGYSVICPRCSTRSECKVELIGHPRELSIVVCEKCGRGSSSKYDRVFRMVKG